MTTSRPTKNLFSSSFLLIHITLAFGAGIALSFQEPADYSLFLIAAIIIGLAGFLALRLSVKLAHILTLVFFLFIGLHHGSSALEPPQASHHIANLVLNQTEASILGVIAKAPEYSEERTTLILESTAIFFPDKNNLSIIADQPLLPFKETEGLIKLSMRDKPAETLHPGDRVLVRAQISPPYGFHNPGGFDHAHFLATKGIFISGWISSGQSIIKMTGPSSGLAEISYIPERLRSELTAFMETNLAEKHSVLYRALITGDRAGLPPELVERFRSLGIVHLLAISGLHMAFLAGGVMGFSYWLLRRSETVLLHYPAKKIAACAALLPLILYCLVAGFQVPALRALLMIMAFMSALLSDRQWHGLTNVSLAALLILLLDPLALSTVSFQLSFAAVTGIILVLPKARLYFEDKRQNSLKQNLIRYGVGSFLVSLAASLATFPLLLYHFNRFSLSGPAATIIIEPFLCMWALGWGLPASLLAPVLPDLSLFFFKVGGFGLDAALFLTDKLQILAQSLWLPTPSILQIVLFYCGILLFIQTRKVQTRVIAASCSLLIFTTPHQLPETDRATVLDVGQGNCTLIETSKGEVIVVDAGGPRSPSFNIGRQVIAPALWSRGIRKIDLLVLSHPDLDHYSGAAFLLEGFSPRVLWVPNKNAHDPGWRNMLNTAQETRTIIHVPQAGENYPLAGSSRFSSIGDLHRLALGNQNNQSLVVRFVSKNHSLLMPGDIEKEAERHLVNKQVDVDSDIIIAPHHGSASSSSREFLDLVTPQTAIFSASRYKKNRYPDKAVLARYSAVGARPILTSEAGAITILFKPERVDIQTAN